MAGFKAHGISNRDRKLEDLSETEIRELDAYLDGRAATGGLVFGEVAFRGMARGVPGLIVSRQMQKNEMQRLAEANINTSLLEKEE
jgi:hypothetical protein